MKNVTYSSALHFPGRGLSLTAQKTFEQFTAENGFTLDILSLNNINLPDVPIIKDLLFDEIATIRIKNETDLLISFTTAYSQILKSHSIDAKTIIMRASSHPNTQYKILKQEYIEFGIKDEPIHPLLYTSMMKSLQETDYTLIPSNFVHDSFIENKYPEDKIIQIPFGVDIDKYTQQPTPEHDELNILFIGDNWIRKGLYYAEKAVSELDNPDITLHVRCNAPKFGNVKYNHINRLDFVPNLSDLYEDIDIFILPSLEEGMALVVLEAMAMGKPVIITPNCGYNEIIEDGKEGFIVEKKNPKMLAKKIIELWENKNLMKKMSKDARKKAEKFSWKKMAAKVFKVYQSVK